MDKRVSLLTPYNLFKSYKKIKTEFRTFKEAKEYISNLPPEVLKRLDNLKRTYLLLKKVNNSKSDSSCRVIISKDCSKVRFSKIERHKYNYSLY